jgi:hypothetical protein
MKWLYLPINSYVSTKNDGSTLSPVLALATNILKPVSFVNFYISSAVISLSVAILSDLFPIMIIETSSLACFYTSLIHSCRPVNDYLLKRSNTKIIPSAPL